MTFSPPFKPSTTSAGPATRTPSLLPRPRDRTHSAKRDFGLGRDASEAVYPGRYSTREQRSPRPKDPLPGGLRRVWLLAALLVSHRALRLYSFLAPCQKPNLPQQSVFYPAVWGVTFEKLLSRA